MALLSGGAVTGRTALRHSNSYIGQDCHSSYESYRDTSLGGESPSCSGWVADAVAVGSCNHSSLPPSQIRAVLGGRRHQVQGRLLSVSPEQFVEQKGSRRVATSTHVHRTGLGTFSLQGGQLLQQQSKHKQNVRRCMPACSHHQPRCGRLLLKTRVECSGWGALVTAFSVQPRSVSARAAVTAFKSAGTDSSGDGDDVTFDEAAASSLFPDIQVQTPEEQERLAATPAHPAALYAMYASYFASCFVEHMWRFAWPALLALMYNSLLPVAVMSFVQQLVIFLGGPLVGEVLDSSPRVFAFNMLNTIQSVSMVVSAGCMAHAFNTGALATSSAGALVSQPWFILLVISGSIERITGLASGVAFERDWVVQLAGPKREIALANANATLRRVDLFCDITGPFAFGLLMTKCSPNYCISLAAISMVGFLPLLLALVFLTDKLSRGVLRRAKHVSVRVPPEPPLVRPGLIAEDHHQEHSQVQGGFDTLLRGWKLYLSQPVLPASLAYVLLSLNAVLAPSGLMTSFLTQRGMEANMIGAFRGCCAAMGFAATFLSTTFISRFGLLKAGAGALLFTAGCLVCSVLVYITSPPTGNWHLFLFLSLIVLSRLGNWVYDVVDAQIFQTAIPTQQASLVGTTELSLASLAELVMLGIAIVADDLKHFGSLALLSTAAVIASAALYCIWISSPSAARQRLFPDAKQSSSDESNETLIPAMQPS